MVPILALLTSGILIGLFLGRKGQPVRWVNPSVRGSIFLLLFFLGVSVGTNREVLMNLGTLGFRALVLAIGAIAGSIALAVVVYNRFFRSE